MALDTHHMPLLLSEASCVASTVCAAALAVPDTECVSGDVTFKRDETSVLFGVQMKYLYRVGV